MWPHPQESADLVTFNEEILNGKLHFLCSAICIVYLLFVLKVVDTICFLTKVILFYFAMSIFLQVFLVLSVMTWKFCNVTNILPIPSIRYQILTAENIL